MNVKTEIDRDGVVANFQLTPLDDLNAPLIYAEGFAGMAIRDQVVKINLTVMTSPHPGTSKVAYDQVICRLNMPAMSFVRVMEVLSKSTAKAQDEGALPKIKINEDGSEEFTWAEQKVEKSK